MKNLVSGFVVGLVVGVVGAFTQADRTYIGSVLLPYGLVLTLTFVVCVQVWFARHRNSRVAGVGVLTGWVVATIGLGFDTPTGDVALAGNLLVTTYLVAGSVVMATLAMLRPRAHESA
jgi:hypothetical protein